MVESRVTPDLISFILIAAYTGAYLHLTMTLPFDATLATLSKLVPHALINPRVGIVCGSGLSTLGSSLKDAVHVPYSDLEGFGTSTGRDLS